MQAVTGEPRILLLVRKSIFLVAAGLALALVVSIPHWSARQSTTTMWRKQRALEMGDASAKGGLPFAVIYYTSINPSHPWKDLLTLQMAELITFGIAPRALSIHVELSTDGDVFSPPNSKNETTNILHSAADLVLDLLPAAQVTLHNKNTFEYPGIHRLWEVANSHHLPRSTILLYFHGKGMWNGNHTVIRSEENKRLTRVVLEPWRDVLQHFKDRPELMKAGYAMSHGGWVWYNFFWVRDSYLRRLVEPIVTPRRHYYEDWLGRLKSYKETRASTGQAQPDNYPLESGGGATAEDGLSLCGNEQLKLGVAYHPISIPLC